MIAPFVIAAGSHSADRLLLCPMPRTNFREANEIDTIIL